MPLRRNFFHRNATQTHGIAQNGKDATQSSTRGRVSAANDAFFAPAESSSSRLFSSTRQQENASPDPQLETPQSVRSTNPRLQSFSLPRKKDPEPETQVSQSPTSSSDRDDLEVTYEYPGSSKHQKPRYLQETLASINSRPRKSSSHPAEYRTSAYSTPAGRTSLPASANTHPAMDQGDPKGSKSGMRNLGRKAVDSMNPALKVPAGRNGKSPAVVASNATPRVLFNTDFPPPTAIGAGASGGGGGLAAQSFASSIRRSITEFPDPSALAGMAATASGAGRPRTAPPRLRKKEIETSDLLYSKKMDTGARMPSDGSQSSRRMRSSMDYGTATANPAGRSSTRRSTVGVSSSAPSTFSTTASFSRSKVSRAQWK